jgi:hypothetical protein
MDDGKPKIEATESDPPLLYSVRIRLHETSGRRGIRAVVPGEGLEKLRDYMKARAKELGLKDVRITARLPRRCELGPSMVIYPKACGTHRRRPPISTRSGGASRRRRPREAALLKRATIRARYGKK